jgi:DNA glycosylase AlkZ-like
VGALVAERILTEGELNRALLARQLLLERADLPLTRALERVGGLQTQYAPSAYIGLWSRLGGFAREDLTRALERRRVIQATSMRATIHMVSARDYPLLTEGVRASRREWWLRSRRGRVDEARIAEAAAALRALLAGGAVRRRAELVEHLKGDSVLWNGVGMWVDLVRVPPSGTWDQRRADLYALAEDWLGPSTATAEEGLDHLLRRYLGGFGPAPLSDAANWAGVPPATLAPSASRLRLRRFRDEAGEELLDLPRAPIPDAEAPAPVRFLPVWDATLLVHARRTQILPERYRSRVFSTRTPQSVHTFLVDGRVAGAWRFERDRVVVEPFGRLGREERRDVDREAERLATFMR